MIENSCNMCGRCCTYEIVITLSDIERISRGLNISPQKFMRVYLKKELSITFGLYMLTKRDDGKCPFIDEKNMCKIHGFKPKVCNEFQCLKSFPTNIVSVPLDNYKTPDQTEEGIATIEYIMKNGFNYNEEEFLKNDF